MGAMRADGGGASRPSPRGTTWRSFPSHQLSFIASCMIPGNSCLISMLMMGKFAVKALKYLVLKLICQIRLFKEERAILVFDHERWLTGYFR